MARSRPTNSEKLADALLPDLGSSAVAVPARNGRWPFVPIPTLWTSGLRMLAISRDEMRLYAATTGYGRTTGELWSGSPDQIVRWQTHMGDRVLRIVLPADGKARLVPVDGRAACAAVRPFLPVDREPST